MAEDDELPVGRTEVGVPPCAVGRYSPLENRAWDVDGSGNGAELVTVRFRADVDDQCSVLRRCECLSGREPRDLGPRVLEEVVQCSSHVQCSHELIRLR